MSTVFDTELPASWSASRLKRVTTLLNRGTAPNYVDAGPVRAISQAANQESGLDWTRTRFHGHIGDPAKIKGHLKPSDVLINSTGTGTLGRVGYFEFDPDGFPCMADSHVTIARVDEEKMNPRFAYYWLGSRPFQGFVYSVLAVGATNQIELNRDRLSDAPVPLPPLDEQCRIADFLDIETGKMDDLVRTQTRLVQVLNERIDHQVLEVIGRSKLANLRDGTPLVAMRWLLQKNVRPTANTPEVVTAFRDGQVTARSLRRAEGYTNSASSEPQGQHVLVGDVVVHGLDGFAGAIGTAEAEGNCSPVNHVLSLKGEGDTFYYGRLLRILALQGYLTGFSFSTRERAFDFRNWDMFGRIPIPVGSVSEQRRIGRDIRKLRPIREKIDQFTARITERRQALITAAVTGQFDVTTASGRNVTDGVTP
ncbi:restriction endonuclease subunit S [Streptomyces sp. Z26]|uniref:restriction endonuclease subunit S n=1 Tax=Streptomyces sp. Z26 TaxID=2500177 RepID=UPI000EF15796|nr:restriction endonuclease subunit S [Streptomyces sp. Z26]RLL68723.1 restriction endonuclease subunit S [Streptomyces sp. Z26]